MHNTLSLIARRPHVGKAKTRLSPPLSAQQACALYECFLRDALDLMRCVPEVSRTLAFLPAEAYGYFSSLAPDMDLVTQRGATLGERLDSVTRHTLADGAAKAVVLASDNPSLPAAYLAQAFALLEGADLVLGPTPAGGCYLAGVKKPQPGLLHPLDRNSLTLIPDTLALARQAGVTVALLPPWYAIDGPQDLERLRCELLETPAAPAAHTRRWLIQSGAYGNA